MRLRKPKPVAEHEASGDVECVYHEITQILRVSGVNLNFRTWAGYGEFLPLLWDAFKPNVETRAYENAADALRADTVRIAGTLGKVDIKRKVSLGESQSYQIQKAIDLYHYVNPKLLVLTSAVRFALRGEAPEKKADELSVELVERGIPGNMYPMEMVSEKAGDELVRSIFKDIKRTLSLPSVNSDYRTLALWPDYLAAAWSGLKPIIQRDEYKDAADQLRETARQHALSLPYSIDLSMEKVTELGENEEVLEKAESFEKLLPGLIIDIAVLQLDWSSADALSRSPFPAARRLS
jgi:hypothetical protein